MAAKQTKKWTRSDVAGLIDKRWDLLAQYKLEAVRERKALGISEALRVIGALYWTAKRRQPQWPTEQDHEADLQTHQRVAEALARTAPFSSRNGIGSRRRDPRVRRAR